MIPLISRIRGELVGFEHEVEDYMKAHEELVKQHSLLQAAYESLKAEYEKLKQNDKYNIDNQKSQGEIPEVSN